MTNPSLSHRGLRLAAFGAVVATSLLVAGCAPPGGSATTDDTQPATEVSQDLGTEPITLVLYDGAGLKGVDEALTAAFTEKHPNVTFELRLDPDNVQAVNAPRVLSSDSPPDLARINALSDIVGDGLLTGLDEYAELYEWNDIPSGQMAQYTVNDEGVRGDGTQYTVASGFTTTGIYYNRELAAQLGLDGVPTTVEDFEKALASAKDAGLIPISAGNKNGQVASTFQFLLNNLMGQQAVNDWIFHVPDATMDTPEAIEAADIIADWGQKGYFGDNPNGVDPTQSLGNFQQGKALFFASGNWDAKGVAEGLGDKAGFAPYPANADGKVLAMSDPLTNFGIPSRAANKNAAAAFLDFLMSDEARQIVVDFNFAPSGVGEAPTASDPLNAAVQDAFAALVADNGQVQFIQNASNGATAEWNAQLQLLVSGNATGAETVKAVQAKYVDELG